MKLVFNRFPIIRFLGSFVHANKYYILHWHVGIIVYNLIIPLEYMLRHRVIGLKAQAIFKDMANLFSGMFSHLSGAHVRRSIRDFPALRNVHFSLQVCIETVSW